MAISPIPTSYVSTIIAKLSITPDAGDAWNTMNHTTPIDPEVVLSDIYIEVVLSIYTEIDI